MNCNSSQSSHSDDSILILNASSSDFSSSLSELSSYELSSSELSSSDSFSSESFSTVSFSSDSGLNHTQNGSLNRTFQNNHNESFQTSLALNKVFLNYQLKGVLQLNQMINFKY